jgi:nucleotide-binding universal stress UspA family protein
MIAEWRKRLELTDLLPAKVIECVNARSIRERVDSLLKYAHDSNADLIVTSTRAKTGVSRWLMGSFAETLALKSNIPMLFVNPSLDPIKQPISLDQILYPTDFSDESIQAFRTLLPIVKALGSKIEIFHQFRYAPSPGLDFAALAGAYIPHDDAKLEIETLRARVELWVDEARKHGVTAHFKISSNPLESVTHALLEESRKLHGAIAMAAMSNPIEVQLLGSITRQIIRTSTLPVWVYRAPAALE